MFELMELFESDKVTTKILGETVMIHYVSNLFVDGEKCEGGCFLSERLIKIDSSLLDDKERLERVVRHEKMHMALGISGLTEIMDPKIEEAICVMMESFK